MALSGCIRIPSCSNPIDLYDRVERSVFIIVLFIYLFILLLFLPIVIAFIISDYLHPAILRYRRAGIAPAHD